MRDDCFVEDRGEPIESVTSDADAERESVLRSALQAFESGSIDAYQYTQRVKAIDRATSAAEMAEALQFTVSRQVPAPRGRPWTRSTWRS